MGTPKYALSALFAVTLAALLVPVSPASGEDCNGACAKSRAGCDSTCEDKKTRCVVQCGLPVLPGYDKCRQTCDDNLRGCSLECVASEKICQVRCKTGQ
jgi:hypothetical protein